MRKIILLSVLVLSGCAYHKNVSDKTYASKIMGQCYIANYDLEVYFADTWPEDTFELIDPERQQLPWRSSLAPWEHSFTIQKGEKIKIVEIYDWARGSSGNCWDIYAVRLQQPERKFSLPACWGTEIKSWFVPMSKHNFNDKKYIELQTKYIESAECI